MFDQVNHPSSTPGEELSPICTVTNEREGVCVVGKVGQTERVGGKGWCSSFDSSLSYSNTGWEGGSSSSWREDLSPVLNKDYVGRIFSLKDRAENPSGVTVNLQMTSSAKTGPRHTVVILSLMATMRNVRSIRWHLFQAMNPDDDVCVWGGGGGGGGFARIRAPLLLWNKTVYQTLSHCLVRDLSSGTVWESRWTSWAVRPNEPSGFRGRKDLLHHASALVTTCP